ncbi:MAG: CBS domain-containing protein [Myxococcales bacterium]|nr:CBS domain-containing protein [Myxococcales bacterium]MCB9737242.1 CBS domain-containing protein [Deltaproteobacteria bacterium]
MRALDIMTEDVITTTRNATIGDALELMYGNDIRHLPVVRDRTLIGILSDRDLRGVFLPDPDDPGVIDVHQLDVRVTELMTGNPVSVGPETDIDEVIEVMIDNRVGAVPVVTGDELVGLVSYVDVLRAAIGKL